jgi:hypothetical protein
MPILDQMVLEQNTEVGLERRKRGTNVGESREVWMKVDVAPPLGCEVDTFQDDCPAWQGDQPPGVGVLLGSEGEEARLRQD